VEDAHGSTVDRRTDSVGPPRRPARQASVKAQV
jgi:hypothetical protein